MTNDAQPALSAHAGGHDSAGPEPRAGTSPLTDLAAGLKTQFAEKPLEVFEQILDNFNHRISLGEASALCLGTHDVPAVRGRQVETEGWTSDHDDEHE